VGRKIMAFGKSMNKNDFINLYIGFDKNEAIAYHVLVQSIMENTSVPVRITPIIKEQIPEYTRKKSNLESTEFSITRFLTPWLSDYEGWSMFVDCDFIFLEDLKNLWDLRCDEYSVMVCQHDYTPKKSTKFLDKIQSHYDRKNWSSLILFNNEKCKALTTEFVNSAEGVDLHQFKWLDDDQNIGSIPLSWNHLCEEENQVYPVHGIHYTNGGPWFKGSRNTAFSSDWIDVRNRALLADPYSENTLVIDDEEYDVIPPRFKGKNLKSDYFQLKRISDDRMFHLKMKGNEHRGIAHKYPYIYMQALGSEIAKYFRIPTQESQIIRLNSEDFLLTKDIRGERHVEGMEPLSYHSEKVIAKTRDLKALKDEMDVSIKGDCSKFFTTMILFDTLICNVQRDARSIRIFEINESLHPESVHDKIETNHEFLIENNFGNFHFSQMNRNPLYSQELIIDFILENKTIETALSFFNALSPENLVNLIKKASYLTHDMRNECIKIFKEQFEYLLEIEDVIIKLHEKVK
jgi:hypothetical protein